ncbi:MAG: GGDEF domain-containing protein, partial [Solirubrobacteraceae bacterium]
EERFRVAFDQAPIGMALIDLEGHFTRVNEALCVITGYARGQLEGMSRDAFTHPDDVQGERAALATMRAGEQTLHSTEKRYIHASGHPISVALQTTLIRHEGAPRRFLLQAQDITDRKRYEAKLQDLADHDSLTGLLNRRSFGRALSSHAALTGRYGAEGALLLIDLDHFKYVNDTIGHQGGDDVIVRAAAVPRGRLRESDVLARLGGDEFAVLLPRADADGANVVAQELLQALRDEPIRLPGNLARAMTASIGIASFDADLSGEDVLVNADLAMYDAKKAGRDRVAHFSIGLHRVEVSAADPWPGRPRGSRSPDLVLDQHGPLEDQGGSTVGAVAT